MTNKLLFVGHDANRAGAQLVLLHWLRARAKAGESNFLLLEKSGELINEFKKVAKVWVWKKSPRKLKISKQVPFLKREEQDIREPNPREIALMIQQFASLDIEMIVGNTVATLGLLQKLESVGKAFGVYVHELAHSLEMYANEMDMAFLAKDVAHVFVVSQQVAEVLVETHAVKPDRVAILPPIVAIKAGSNAENIRASLGIPAAASIVLGCGMAKWRKGTDIFVEVAARVMMKRPECHFVWLGMTESSFSQQLMDANVDKRIHLLPAVSDVRPYFEAMDVLFLSSREDPFPLVMLEAAVVGKPILGFQGAGGVNDFLRDFPQFLVEDFSVNKAVDQIESQLAASQDDLAKLKITLQAKALHYTADAFLQRWRELYK